MTNLGNTIRMLKIAGGGDKCSCVAGQDVSVDGLGIRQYMVDFRGAALNGCFTAAELRDIADAMDPPTEDCVAVPALRAHLDETGQ